MINLEILGKFYDNHSLSLINRQLATHLNNCKDFDVFLTPLDSPNPNCSVDGNTLKAAQNYTIVNVQKDRTGFTELVLEEV